LSEDDELLSWAGLFVLRRSGRERIEFETYKRGRKERDSLLLKGNAVVPGKEGLILLVFCEMQRVKGRQKSESPKGRGKPPQILQATNCPRQTTQTSAWRKKKEKL